MHTVIILNKQSSDLLKDFRFLYKPFVDEGTISFCDWNEAGTDLKSAVPDIYKCIKGKPDWRAIVLNTDSMAVIRQDRLQMKKIHLIFRVRR